MQAAQADVRPGGMIAVVVFSHTSSFMFRRWMAVNHVRMEGHLWPPPLRASFEPLGDESYPAYAEVWQYGTFIGRKHPA